MFRFLNPEFILRFRGSRHYRSGALAVLNQSTTGLCVPVVGQSILAPGERLRFVQPQFRFVAAFAKSPAPSGHFVATGSREVISDRMVP
jgi:hypothetical protein